MITLVLFYRTRSLVFRFENAIHRVPGREERKRILDDCKKFGNEVLQLRKRGIPVGQTRTFFFFSFFSSFN